MSLQISIDKIACTAINIRIIANCVSVFFCLQLGRRPTTSHTHTHARTWWAPFAHHRIDIRVSHTISCRYEAIDSINKSINQQQLQFIATSTFLPFQFASFSNLSNSMPLSRSDRLLLSVIWAFVYKRWVDRINWAHYIYESFSGHDDKCAYNVQCRCATSERHRKNGGATSQTAVFSAFSATLLLFTFNRKLHNCTFTAHISVVYRDWKLFRTCILVVVCIDQQSEQSIALCAKFSHFHSFIIFHLAFECLGLFFGCNPSSSLNKNGKKWLVRGLQSTIPNGCVIQYEKWNLWSKPVALVGSRFVTHKRKPQLKLK